jgi:transposase
MDGSGVDPVAGIRFRPVVRDQLPTRSLDELLPSNHPARSLVAFVQTADLSELFQAIKARDHHPGAPAFDPRVLFSVWLYAAIEGISSARELHQRCGSDLPFLWICGQEVPNYHTLADFYSDHEQFLNEVFTDHLEILLEAELIDLKKITLDGRKVPASASKESFHREPTLSQHRQQAQAHLQAIRQQRQQTAEEHRRKAAAQQRAAEERQQRLEAALAMVKQRQEEKAARGRKDEKPEDVRASETDPDARKMKMSHGGYQPAYNVQTVTDVATGLIVTVAVTNQGSDNGLLKPMLDKMAAETGVTAAQALVDTGYIDLKDIEAVEEKGTQVHMPPKHEKQDLKDHKDPYAPKRDDKPKVAEWRARMGTAVAKALYKKRAPVAEGVHAQQSNRGWKRFRLRGLKKAGVEALWQALAHNLTILIQNDWLGKVRAEPATAA